VWRAQELLETTHESVERIATLAGFESATTLRDRFRRTAGVSPMQYRRSFSQGKKKRSS
jgi:transcriptional regulator GlxA family with amidase domain